MFFHKLSFFILFYFTFCQLPAQSSTLTYESYIQQVIGKHPISKQINLAEQKARLQEMYARGSMDPELNSNWAYKQFDGKNYYNIFDAYLRIPTITGIDVISGYQYADGFYLNDADKLPDAGQAFLGIALPVGQGLWNNERQTALRQAKLMQKAAKSEIRSSINNLLFEAAKHYWEWTLAYNNSLAWQRALNLAKGQFIIIKSSYEQGDLPAIDTLKSYILIQDFEIQLNDAQLSLRKARWLAENYLWMNDTTVMQLNDDIVPQLLDSVLLEKIDSTELEKWIQNIDQHPDMLLYNYQLQALELEERLKNNKLLPKAEVKYNLLSSNHVAFFQGTGIGAFTEQYKLGFKLQYPILIRKERADLALNRIKQQETGFKMNFKGQEITSKIKTYFNSVETYADQSERLNSMISNYSALIEAERLKFAQGESDLLIVNTREVQYVEAQLKRYKTIVKYLESKTAWIWATAQW
jgi:outer membrane protein TolC